MSVTIFPASSPDEKHRSLRIYNDVWPHRAVTADHVEAWERASIATIDLLGTVGGVDAGSGAGSINRGEAHVATLIVTVLPAHRRRGVGSALFTALTAWAADEDVAELEVTADADDVESIGFAHRRGFTEHSRELGLALELDARELTPVAPPAGTDIALLAARPELAEGVYDVAAEALPDIPGNEDWKAPPFEDFAASHLRGEIFVAVAGGEVVAYAKLRARPDGRTFDHGMTAVKRNARGRGIASALKRAQIVWAKEHGVERLTATNEERNAPMRRVNESLGYRPAPGRVFLRRPVEATTR